MKAEDDLLETSLRALARKPLPAAPDDVSLQVWREISRRREGAFWSRILPLLGWREFFREPRVALAAFACAVVVGVLPSAVWTKVQNEQRFVRASLHFDVFSHSPTDELAALFAGKLPGAKSSQP